MHRHLLRLATALVVALAIFTACAYAPAAPTQVRASEDTTEDASPFEPCQNCQLAEAKREAEHKRGNRYKAKFIKAQKALNKERKAHRKHHTTSGSSSAVASVYSIATNGGTTTASGIPLSDSKATFAHKSMKFGTRVRFSYKGRSVTAVCTDRGPYVSGRTFDLSTRTAKAVGFPWGVARVSWRVVKK